MLDMLMEPGIDGLETYQRILKERPYQRGIIFSGFPETDRVQAAVNFGAAVLGKPYTLDELKRAVARAPS